MTEAPFGVMLTAMISPFNADGSLDLDGAQRLAVHLVDDLKHDGLVINGTTGEASTKSDEEDIAILTAVLEAVGDRATVIAGVGTNDTAHSILAAKAAARAGAHAVMAVTPYYNRPSQAGVAAHFLAIADATDLPMITYDIPKRTGTAIELDTLKRIAEHPRIVANKDAKGDLEFAQWGMRETGLAWYSGDDALNLALMAVGACGMISVVGHIVGDRLANMAAALSSGDIITAQNINTSLLPIYTGIFRAPGVVMAKAALNLQGWPAGTVRLPLLDATDTQIEQLRIDLAAGGVN
ncbi:MAG: Dihydrodipicolinate synthase 1 [Actinomycetota bacterium]